MLFCSWHMRVIFIQLLFYACNRTAIIVKSLTCRQDCGHSMKKAVAYLSSWRAHNTCLFVITTYTCLSIHSRKQRGLYPTVGEKKQDRKSLNLDWLIISSSSVNIWGPTTNGLGFAGRLVLGKEKVIFTCGKDLIVGEQVFVTQPWTLFPLQWRF